MKKFIAIYTDDNGRTRKEARTVAPDYTKAYLNIIRDFIALDIIIIELTEEGTR